MPERDSRRSRPRRVLIPRPGDRGTGLARRLERLGAAVDLRPTIAFDDPRDLAARDRALAGLGGYDWVVVTSPTGVARLLDAVGDREATWPPRVRLAAVGPGTAAALERRGLRAELVARRADAEGLAADLVPRVERDARVLLVRPESGARDVLVDALRGRGASVAAVAFYRTVASPDAAAIAADVADGRYTAAVFSSPSTFLRLLDAAGERRPEVERALASMTLVAIGPVTERALRDAGLRPDAVAAAPTDEAVETALVAVW